MTTLTSEKLLYLQNKALNLRIDSIRATTASKSGHPTSALSVADIVSTLFFYTMKYDPQNPKALNNDRLILSKGHAIPVVYAAWKQVGVITDAELLTLRKFDSVLEGHPTPRFKYNEAATGSLGQGLSIGIGMALNAKLDNFSYKTYVIIGDAESAEGSIWEAAELASHYKLNNLIGILDCNRLGQSTETLDGYHTEIYKNKFSAFGWNSIVVDGHNIEEIVTALEKANTAQIPTMIIAKTMKGYGLTEIANKEGFHGKPFNELDAKIAIEELKNKFKDANNYKNTTFTPTIPVEPTISKKETPIVLNIETDNALFEKVKQISTRKAFGYALTSLGTVSENTVVLDADVKNSTFTEFFEQKFPKRFFECFIAEQNMISIATGLELRNKIPFTATFAAFLTRAFDQIRMAGIGKNALRICGSHCGVSIGEDGPSQMGLEDIAMIRSIPNSIIFYPSDAISTYKIIELMANYTNGISYIRTTRMDTDILYDKNESFKIGGCKVLKQSNDDKVCIIAAGVTLHESLKAYEELKKENINVSIIDLYCVKPLDIETILKIAQKSSNKIVTVEDHYEAGGIGEAIKSALINQNIKIKSLFVSKISRSGTPQELLTNAEIDKTHIIKTIKNMN